MIAWVESQSVTVIVLAGYGACFAIAALAFAAGAAVARTRFADALHLVTPALLTPLGVILGLLLVFLSSRVWSNVDHAHAFAAQEASAVRELIRITDVLPPQVAAPVLDGVNAYLRWLNKEDWPRMLAGQGEIMVRLPGLGASMTALTAYNATLSGERAMQHAALAAIEKARDARRGRILLSKTNIGAGQWLVVFVLFAHMLLLIATIHLRRRTAMAVALAIFSSAFAICIVLLLIYDRPFRSGGLTVEPVGLEGLVVE